MTAALRPSACPACAAAPAAEAVAESPSESAAQILISLPTIHCAACIAKIEQGLEAEPGVRGARVNLTRKRASITADPEITPAHLVRVVEALGYEAYELDTASLRATETDRAGRDLLMRMAVAGFASMNVMLLSISVWSGAEDATRDLFHWISAAIALPTIAFAGQPFFRNAWIALRAGRLNMDVPISLAILLAVATSLWETVLSGEHAYFDAAVALTFFLLAGRYLDHRTRAVARSAAEELTALEVPRACRISADGQEEEVDVTALAPGDLIRVRPGSRLPVDGEVTDGTSELDRSFLTGETIPVFAGPGHAVSAGEVNLSGPMTVRATAVGADTSLHRMADLVAVAEAGRARYTSLADRAAKLYAPGVHILSALAFLGWFIATWDVRTALNIAAAVLIITCPCALGLAVPAVTTAASGKLFRRGMLIKHETALERLAEVDVVVFDKTGTLTEGDPKLIATEAITSQNLSLARALAEGTSHPLARAIVQLAKERGVTAATLEDVREVPGYGVLGRSPEGEVRLGRADWVGVAPGAGTETCLRVGADAPVRFAFEDALREGAAETVRELIKDGKRVILVSGDTQSAVAGLAVRVGIAEWVAAARPEDKVQRIEALARDGAHVLMVGDGLNDTAALAAAHVSISPASALDAARAASDIVLLGRSLAPVAGALGLARQARSRITENFRIATIYNIIAVPLAVAGLATPLIAALAMSASSITVSLNALRLR